ncbi:hypothetical protein ACQ4PT_007453 [Festuca glaucescens]
MELRSGRRLRRSPRPDGPRSHRMDLSSLPDEILLLVLARIGCIRAAVQTSLLSRRWRGLWSGLTDLTFRGLAPAMIEALFPHFAASPQVSTLDIGLPRTRIWPDTTGANSLLRASLLLSPRKLLFTFQPDIGYDGDIELPCFHGSGTTSMELDTVHFGVKPLLPGEFAALESLTVNGKITDLDSWLNCCPRLRVLRVKCPDNYLFRITQSPARELPMLEEISLTGRIVGLESLLHRCQRLRVLSVT